MAGRTEEIRRRRSLSEEGKVLRERTRRHKNKDKPKCGEAEMETGEGGMEGEEFCCLRGDPVDISINYH